MTASQETETESEFLGFLMRGAELLRASRLEEAREAITQALALEAGEPRARNLLGLVHFRSGELPESRDVYRALCGDYPEEVGYRLNLGLVHLRIGEVDEAIAAIEQVVAAESDNTRAYGYLGLAYAQVGDVVRAREAFLRAGQPELAQEMEEKLAQQAEGEEAATVDGEAPAGVARAIEDAQEAAVDQEPLPAGDAVAAAPVPEDGYAGRGEERDAPSEPADAPSSVVEFEEQSTAVAPDEVLQMAVRMSSGPDDEEVDAAFSELEYGPVPEPASPSADVGSGPVTPPPYEEEVIEGAPPAADEPSGAEAPGTVDPGTPFDLRVLAEVCRQGEKEAEADGLMAPEGETEVPISVDGDESEAEVGPGVTRVSALVTRSLLRLEAPAPSLSVGPAGTLVCRIDGSLVTRLGAGAVISGHLDFEVAMARVRGRPTDEPLGGDRPFHHVRGQGTIVAMPRDAAFVALQLDDDIVYVREHVVYAFSDDLHWEQGRIPGFGPAGAMLQFRGRGQVALLHAEELLHVKLERGQSLGVDGAALYGWVGRVVPHSAFAGGEAGRYVGCTGEGVLLVGVPSRSDT